jgi:hypothetical protein
MSGEPDHLRAFTHALAGVPPDPGRLQRDALLFAAGRAAGRRGAFWPATAALLAALSTALTVALVSRPANRVEVVRVLPVPRPVPADVPRPVPAPDDRPETTEAPPSPALAEGLRLRQRVLREGVGALPQTIWTSPAPIPSPEVPDLYSLRLNASQPDRGQWR